MITNYSFHADFRSVAQRLAAAKRQPETRRPMQPVEQQKRTAHAVSRESRMQGREQAAASSERVA